MADSNPILVSADRAKRWARAVLEHAGVPSDHALTVVESLVLADLRGVDTHGINRLPGYVARIQAGSLNPNPRLEVIQKTPVMASLDAGHTFGFVAAHLATDCCIEMAETYGVGITAVKNSNHFGMAAIYVLKAIRRGLAAMVFSNASPAMPPWGSKEPLWGTNPLAIGLPGGSKGDFILDMSPSVVSRGKVIKAARRGESIPEGWMLDADGCPTTDANAALKGTVLPMGGPKGSGLAAVVDIFSGLLTGASFAGAVVNGIAEPSKLAGTGHWIMVFRPEAFLDSREEYSDRMDTLMARVRSCELASGFSQILTPGQNSMTKQETRSKTGIPFTREEVAILHNLAAKLGCDEKLVETGAER